MSKKITFDFGKYAVGSKRKVNRITVTMELRYKDEKPVLSICGNIYNAKSTDIICGGQCLDEIANYVKNGTFRVLYHLWQKHHLNDTHAWCSCDNNHEHDKYFQNRLNAIPLYVLVEKNNGFQAINDVTEEGLKNFDLDFFDVHAKKDVITRSNKEEKPAWLYYDVKKSPEGLIGKVCPICGAKYGHGWYYHEIPADDLNIINKLIDNNIKPITKVR